MPRSILLASLVLLGLAVIYYGIVNVRFALSRSRLLKRHRGLGLAEFLAHFESMGIAPEIATCVYDYCRWWMKRSSFQPHPDDDLDSVYRMLHDLDDVLSGLIHRLGYEMPHSGILSEGNAEIRTVSDVVRWLNWVRQRQGAT